METTRFVRFNPNTDQSMFDSLIDCYRQVFADEPWNEWKVCKKCGKKWGKVQEKELEQIGFVCCGQAVEDFWPSDNVRQDFLHEITEFASCILAIENDRVIGFCLGYRFTPFELEKKLKLPGLSGKIKEMFGLEEHDYLAYQDDMGVLKEYRNQGIAKKLFYTRLQDFLKMNLRVGMFRTMTNPPSVTYLWFRRLGYKVIDEYHDHDERVVMGRTLDDLKE